MNNKNCFAVALNESAQFVNWAEEIREKPFRMTLKSAKKLAEKISGVVVALDSEARYSSGATYFFYD